MPSNYQARVIERRCIFRELLSMGCYLEDYRVFVGTWAAGTSWAMRTTWHTSQGNGRVIFCLGTTILCATTLDVLLVNGGMKKNLDLVWRLRRLRKLRVAGATEI
jgi:hypothetical protein